MIIESGVIIFLGMVLLGFKLPTSVSLRMLGRPFLLDISASAIAYMLHMGTFSGVMAAAVAGLMCSGFVHIARKTFGYVKRGVYIPGYMNCNPIKPRIPRRPQRTNQ